MKRKILTAGITLLLTGAAGMDSANMILPIALCIVGMILIEFGLGKGKRA